jgi:hypothetical protein
MRSDSDFSIRAFYKDGYYHIFDGHHRAYYWHQLNQERIKIELMPTSKEALTYVSTYRKPLVDHIVDLKILSHEEFESLPTTTDPK